MTAPWLSSQLEEDLMSVFCTGKSQHTQERCCQKDLHELKDHSRAHHERNISDEGTQRRSSLSDIYREYLQADCARGVRQGELVAHVQMFRHLREDTSCAQYVHSIDEVQRVPL